MALIGTISGSVGSGGILTSNNAITGTLVVANVSTNFPVLPSDTIFFVSGSTSGTEQSVFGGNLVVSGTADVKGDITGSNLRLTGDIAVIGGDLTSTAATFNLLSGVGTINIGSPSAATTVNVNGTNNQSITNIAAGANTNAVATKTINIGENTRGSGFVTINIGSEEAAEGRGRITLHNEVLLTSGTIVGSTNGTGINLVSSGNIVAKLDTDNSADGHKFAVQDWRNIDQFSVGENGNAELSGSLIVSGSSIQTVTTTTYNFLTTALTGTLNVGSLTNTINVGGLVTTSSFAGDIAVAGRTNIACVVERLVNSNGGSGTVAFDLGPQGIFYVNNPTGNITANFTNVPTTTNRVITPTIILSQSTGATRPIVSAVQIDGVGQTINWTNGITPTGNSGKQDVFGFSLIRSGSGGGITWKVLGQMSTYG